jgi:hypothetical protein
MEDMALPTDPAPPSDEFDTVEAAKTRAAIALFDAIGKLASERKDPEQLHWLAESFKVMASATVNDELRSLRQEIAALHNGLAQDSLDGRSATE